MYLKHSIERSTPVKTCLLIKSYVPNKYVWGFNTVVIATTHNKKRMATAKKKKEKHPKGFAQIPGTD